MSSKQKHSNPSTKPSKSTKSTKSTKLDNSTKSKQKSKFYNVNDPELNIQESTSKSSATQYSDIIDLLSVSPSASNPNSVNWQDQMTDFAILFLKYSFLVVVLTLNFLGLSVSLNCNADQEMATRIFSGIFAFFFGFVYLIVNYYTYKVLSQGKICKMNREKLFPFKV